MFRYESTGVIYIASYARPPTKGHWVFHVLLLSMALDALVRSCPVIRQVVLLVSDQYTSVVLGPGCISVELCSPH